ncbi:hypothetical protein PR048_025749 [Dryococelus australis]|uniref:Uncharacterized protein n=1 Tax=Dryococelus australis TaxID=614101 RepID=A0ABQ9GJE5_9NEOP|nr:hypothetical protein PR048_025749 [Dryococelus australis]
MRWSNFIKVERRKGFRKTGSNREWTIEYSRLYSSLQTTWTFGDKYVPIPLDHTSPGTLTRNCSRYVPIPLDHTSPGTLTRNCSRYVPISLDHTSPARLLETVHGMSRSHWKHTSPGTLTRNCSRYVPIPLDHTSPGTLTRNCSRYVPIPLDHTSPGTLTRNCSRYVPIPLDHTSPGTLTRNYSREVYDDAGRQHIAAQRVDKCRSFRRSRLLVPDTYTLPSYRAHPRTLSLHYTNRAQSPAGSLDFRKWESCQTMPLVGGSSRESPVFPTHLFRRSSIFTSITLIGSQDLDVTVHCLNKPHTPLTTWLAVFRAKHAERQLPSPGSLPWRMAGDARDEIKCEGEEKVGGGVEGVERGKNAEIWAYFARYSALLAAESRHDGPVVIARGLADPRRHCSLCQDSETSLTMPGLRDIAHHARTSGSAVPRETDMIQAYIRDLHVVIPVKHYTPHLSKTVQTTGKIAAMCVCPPDVIRTTRYNPRPHVPGGDCPLRHKETRRAVLITQHDRYKHCVVQASDLTDLQRQRLEAFKSECTDVLWAVFHLALEEPCLVSATAIMRTPHLLDDLPHCENGLRAGLLLKTEQLRILLSDSIGTLLGSEVVIALCPRAILAMCEPHSRRGEAEEATIQPTVAGGGGGGLNTSHVGHGAAANTLWQHLLRLPYKATNPHPWEIPRRKGEGHSVPWNVGTRRPGIYHIHAIGLNSRIDRARLFAWRPTYDYPPVLRRGTSPAQTQSLALRRLSTKTFSVESSFARKRVSRGDIWAALAIEPMRVKRGECGATPECKTGGKWEIRKKTRRPGASSGAIPSYGYPRTTPQDSNPLLTAVCRYTRTYPAALSARFKLFQHFVASRLTTVSPRRAEILISNHPVPACIAHSLSRGMVHADLSIDSSHQGQSIARIKTFYRIRIRLERISQKQFSYPHKTPYDRAERSRERKINIKASERVNVEVFT